MNEPQIRTHRPRKFMVTYLQFDHGMLLRDGPWDNGEIASHNKGRGRIRPQIGPPTFSCSDDLKNI